MGGIKRLPGLVRLGPPSAAAEVVCDLFRHSCVVVAGDIPKPIVVTATLFILPLPWRWASVPAESRLDRPTRTQNMRDPGG